MGSTANGQATQGIGRVRIWDLPTRLFHWSLAALVAFSFITAKVGGAWTQWHFYSGYSILTLLLFRLLWGFAGSLYARFATFVRGPRAIAAQLRSDPYAAGHSPLAGLSVLAMLLALLVQAGTGLFASDDIASEGPLFRLVTQATGALLTRIHRWNELVVIALLALHFAAALYYLLIRRRNLIVPMFTGDQPVHGRPAEDDRAPRIRAALLLVVAAALVAYIVNL
jgi:cytochrome b